MFAYYILLVICIFNPLKADYQKITQGQYGIKDVLRYRLYNAEGYLFPYPEQCYDILEEFAQGASSLTLCTILNTRPIRLCENCVENFVKFRDKYNELWKTVVNGTSCRSIFISHDRLNAVQQYHDNIMNIWNSGNCNGCFDWNKSVPSLNNDTIHFHKLYNITMDCIITNMVPNNSEVCNRCMQSYVQLDEFYKTLSSDSIGVDSVCMDIVDSMNATRLIWSKTLDCCNLRRTPELVFLCSAGIIAFLPMVFYYVVRYCGPIQDLPNVLKQTRFKQTLLRGLSVDSRSD